MDQFYYIKRTVSEWIKKMWYIHKMEYYSILEGNSSIYNTEEPGEHYAKWNKPDTGRQILHDTTFIRNLK